MVIDTVAAYSHMFSRGSRPSSGPPAVAPLDFPRQPRGYWATFHHPCVVPALKVVLMRVCLDICVSFITVGPADLDHEARLSL